MGLKWFERCSSWDIWRVLSLFEFLEFHGEIWEFVNTDCSFQKMKHQTNPYMFNILIFSETTSKLFQKFWTFFRPYRILKIWAAPQKPLTWLLLWNLVLLVSNLPVKLSWWSPDAGAAPPPTPLSCRMRRIVRAVCPCLPRWRWSRPWGRRWRRWVRRAPSSGPWSQRWSPVPRWRRSRWSRPSERRRWNWRPSTSRTSAYHADRTDLQNKKSGLWNSDLSGCCLS